ncbi:IPT/TIG domain-containing protein [Kitasatospora sp. McL0602]|uniref:IPT/TIG domain-containing protein n=1 Tax=Kitasatospora sp. McL0602 TaxID=3439530 RepID=UPI003F8C45D6
MSSAPAALIQAFCWRSCGARTGHLAEGPWSGPATLTCWRGHRVPLTVTVIDTATQATIAAVSLSELPFDLAVTPDGTRAYVSNANRTIVVAVDLATLTVTATSTTGTAPVGLGVSADSSHLYVANAQDDNLLVVDTASNTVTDTLAVGSGPNALTLSPDRSRGYTTNVFSNDVTVVQLTPTPPSAPAVTAISPTSGLTTGTTVVTVTGTALTGATAVTFGGTPGTGPSPVTSATLTATLPPGATATNLSTGCTTASGTVTCTYGTIANGASVNKTFRIPLHLLSLGHVTVTGARATSAPTDPNPANDSASASRAAVGRFDLSATAQRYILAP